MKARFVFGVVFSLLCLTSVASAQNYRGSIRGTVTDPNAAVIAGAKLKLTNTETNKVQNATTNQTGDYAFLLLQPGTYQLQVEQSGFGKFAESVQLSVNQELRFNVTLRVSGIEIVDDGAIWTQVLNNENASLGAVIDNKQVTGLPLDGRNFLELALLAPGTTPSAQGSAGSVRGDFAFTINGQREDANNFLLDGVYNVDPKLNTFGVKPPVDAIGEFAVISSVYDASLGRSAGAQISVALKSGSNSFHGTAYEFLRNQALDARNYFAPADQPDPTYRRNQFGFSIGGPIIKDRTFFFGDYEGTRLREGITRLANVPTARERVGDFSQLPQQFWPLIPGTANQFPGGVIPQQALNPIGLKIAALYPLPNRNVPGQNFVASPEQRDRNDSFDVRLDQVINDRSRLTARYSFADRELFEPYSGVTQVFVPGYGNTVYRRGQNLMLNESHTFSPTFVNDARIAFSRVANQVQIENAGRSVNQQVGLPELSLNSRDFGLSFIRVTG
ncbi:MAG: carboxypeptidase regulatory-like domain-containing protein, partial [Acidobacteria bacterium]|nr:carboxypeptidase regulatory-like domain-containing protein [Acidobacteriota bacterium]